MSEQVLPTGQPFLRLGPTTGWSIGPGGLGEGILVGSDGMFLGIAGRLPISDSEPSGTFGGRTLPRGVAIGPEGAIFLADPEQRLIWVRRPGAAGIGDASPLSREDEPPPFVPLWPARHLPPADAESAADPRADPYTLVRPIDVAFSPSGDLAIADAGAGRVLILAYPTARLRQVLECPGGSPTAVTFDAAGHAYVADPLANTIRRFSATGRLDRGFPHPSTTLKGPEHVAVSAHFGSPGANSGCAYPLGSENCRCSPYPGAARHHARAGSTTLLAVLDRTGPVLLLDGCGRVVSGAEVPDLVPRPITTGIDGGLTWTDHRQHGQDPLRLQGLTSTQDGREPTTDRPLLARPRRFELPRSGSFTTGSIDGGQPGFVWDRLVLSTSIPADAWILVSTLTSDSDIEIDLVNTGRSGEWTAPLRLGLDTLPEVLIQSPPGRYLWVRLEFFGDGLRTPLVRRVDIHGPRRGSIHWLPATYHQDPVSRDFLDRFLAYFDTVFAEVGAEHRDSTLLFDPRTAPAGVGLDWLAGWFGLSFPPEWSPEVRREAVAEAMAYASERGTVRGLRRVLQWHTGLPDPLPAIIEHFRLPEDRSSDPPLRVGGQPLEDGPAPHACTVVLPAAAAPDGPSRDRVEQLLREHLPAHVRHEVRYVFAGIVVGHQSAIGIDTLVVGDPDGPLGAGQLGVDLVTLGTREGPLPLFNHLPSPSRSPSC